MTLEEAVRRIERATNKKLRQLNLSGLDLKELPPEIVKCTHLTGLLLNSNEITSIPEALGQLSNLTWLDLNNNQITSIPESLKQLPKLNIYE